MVLAKNFFGSFDGNGVGGTGSVVHCSSGVRTLWTGLLRCGSAHEAHFHSQGAKLRNRSEYVEVWGACVVVLVKRVYAQLCDASRQSINIIAARVAFRNGENAVVRHTQIDTYEGLHS